MIKPIETVLAPYAERREALKAEFARALREVRFGKREVKAHLVREAAWDRSSRKGGVR